MEQLHAFPCKSHISEYRPLCFIASIETRIGQSAEPINVYH